MNITIGKPCAITEKGFKVKNEDSIYPSPEIATSNQRLFLICDGAGEALKGDIASALVSEHIQAFFSTMLESGEPTHDFIQKAIQYTEASFDTYTTEHPDTKGIRSTLAMLYIGNSGITIAHIGDSRIYHFRKGEIIYRTEDHLNKHIKGLSSHVDADVALIQDIQEGDYFFICNCGVMENLSDELLSNVFRQKLPTEIIKDEIAMLCDAKTHDNYSFYIIPVQNVQDSATYKQNILSFLYSFI